MRWLFICFALCSCSKEPASKQSLPVYPVSVVKSEKQDIPIYSSVIGHVDPISTIKVQSRIEGSLMKAYFEEGQVVKKDELLFTIDPRPYNATLQKAKAGYEQALAQLRLSEDKVKRFTPLVEDEYYSQNDFDTLVQHNESNKALLKENKANIESAALNVDYCYIYSPITGVAGMYQIDPGNMVFPTPSSTLVTINQIEPIYVKFFLPENQLQKLFYYKDKNPIKIEVSLDDTQDTKVYGKLNLINNQVDTETGMITVRGIFENKDHRLWPGEFVSTKLIYKIEEGAIIIPYQAVQSTPEGPVVYIVKEGNTVDLRKVVLGQRENGNIIIKQGLSDNETVVIEGQLNLSPGSKVKIANTK